jgi:hypothetical protein
LPEKWANPRALAVLNQNIRTSQVFAHGHSTAGSFEEDVNPYRRSVQVFVKHSELVPIWRHIAPNYDIKVTMKVCD